MNQKIAIRRRVRSGFLLAGLILSWTIPAWANNAPGPMELLPTTLILPLMAAFTAIGGGYTAMRAQGIKRRMVLAFFVGLVANVFCMTHEGLGAVGALVFGSIAIVRAAKLIAWGRVPRREPAPPAPPEPPVPSALFPYEIPPPQPPPQPRRPPLPPPGRLIAAGRALAVVTVALAGMSISAVPMGSPHNDSTGRLEATIKAIVAHELALGRQHRDDRGTAHYDTPSKPLTRWGGRGEFKLGPGGKSFQVWVWPTRFPLFPFNYLGTYDYQDESFAYRHGLPSLYADESGQIRMIAVNRTGQRCPADAPVYFRVPQDFRTYEFRATVKAVDAARQILKLTNANASTPLGEYSEMHLRVNVDSEPCCRVFDLDDPALLEKLKPGDRISATVYELFLSYRADDMDVYDIFKVKPAPKP
jgi:hypothetical protein